MPCLINIGPLLLDKNNFMAPRLAATALPLLSLVLVTTRNFTVMLSLRPVVGGFVPVPPICTRGPSVLRVTAESSARGGVP